MSYKPLCVGLPLGLLSNATLANAASSSTWTPAQLFLSGQQGVWYDPSDLTTLFQNSDGTGAVTADGDPVGYIADKSGNGNHAIQATAGKRPLYKTSAGLSWLAFDGTDDFLATSNINLSAASSLGITTALTPASTAAGAIFEFSANSGSTDKTFGIFQNLAAAGQLASTCRSDALDYLNTTTNTLGNGVTSLISFQGMDITQASATGKMPMRCNAATIATTVNSDAGGAGTVYSTQVLYFGARGGTSLIAAAKVYGGIIRGTPFTAGELANTETWLGAKAGLTL